MFLSLVYLKTAKIRGREGCGENRDTKFRHHPYFYHQTLVCTQSSALGHTLTRRQTFVSRYQYVHCAHTKSYGAELSSPTRAMDCRHPLPPHVVH